MRQALLADCLTLLHADLCGSPGCLCGCVSLAEGRLCGWLHADPGLLAAAIMFAEVLVVYFLNVISHKVVML